MCDNNEGLFIQITTHDTLLQRKDLPLIAKSVEYEDEQIYFFPLLKFSTEMEFCDKIK